MQSCGSAAADAAAAQPCDANRGPAPPGPSASPDRGGHHLQETTEYADFVWTTLQAVDGCATSEQLGRLIAQTFERLGATVYVGVDARSTANGPEVKVRFGQTAQEWEDRYFEARHAAHDPMVRHMLTSSEVVYWSDVAFHANLSARQRRVFEEAGEFGLPEGLAVPLHHPGGGVSAVLLMGEGLDAHDGGHRRAALLISQAFSRAARRLKLGAAPFDPDTPGLSRRETQALYWVRKGAKDKEIGLLMGISPHVVANYIRTAGAKLGVTGRGVIARVAADLGLLPAYLDEADGLRGSSGS